ncbi:hypothetical protein BABINDRAFT_163759 [Babjeviella inositovora NRRL Y-12698]|uniref:Uncharacterized protein n=1 Tax=Babjeviella inositovora NRRL Y-12698 TaxID=984486 RepID=A0A1E3QHS3_9ASCO|nr:uncharacterized protein BABINDRAFT_163759 [Babjeviella inositovora NRRL Y-12698]ODQ77263.1 hypothetical protein BABINDRAFT_163759 [Babjeviella inositovora NRRL Y-12698]
MRIPGLHESMSQVIAGRSGRRPRTQVTLQVEKSSRASHGTNGDVRSGDGILDSANLPPCGFIHRSVIVMQRLFSFHSW